MEVQSNKDAATGAQLSRPPLMRLFVWQLLVLLVISTALLFMDSTAALSAFVGGLISIGPNAYFARWAFRFSGARAAGDVARSFYRGEAGKFLSTAVLFAGAFVLIIPINPAVLFLTYIFIMALNWILAQRVINR